MVFSGERSKPAVEYTTWKRLLKYSYDFVYTKALDWPSLTCEWHPWKYPIPESYKLRDDDMIGCWQRLIVGTHTLNEQNYLMVIGVFIPDDWYQKDDDDIIKELEGGYGEFGGFESMQTLCKVELKIPHQGEVNRARHMPSSPRLVASKAPMPDVLIFDLLNPSSSSSQCTSTFGSVNECAAELHLKGHKSEGYGIDWNVLKTGFLVSGSDDGSVCVWDVNDRANNKNNSSSKHIDALNTYQAHATVVEDVCWNRFQKDIFLSVGDDRTIALWDLREKNGLASLVNKDAHANEINCIDCSPFSEHVFVTGSADKLVCMWDTRNMSKSQSIFKGHADEVFQVQWSPFFKQIMASCGSDANVICWDVERSVNDGTTTATTTNALDRSEIRFIHRGHGTKISDFNWCKATPWAACSTSADNAMQVWKPTKYASN